MKNERRKAPVYAVVKKEKVIINQGHIKTPGNEKVYYSGEDAKEFIEKVLSTTKPQAELLKARTKRFSGIEARISERLKSTQKDLNTAKYNINELEEKFKKMKHEKSYYMYLAALLSLVVVFEPVILKALSLI